MNDLDKFLLYVALPFVVVLSLIEAVVLSRKRSYDWRAAGVSLLDLVGQRTPAPDGFADAWVKAVSASPVDQIKPKPNFNKLVKRSRIQLLSELKGLLTPMLPKLCRGLPGSAYDHIVTVLEPIHEGRDPTALPSVEIVAGLDAAIALELNRKVQANDMLDFLHAAQALPYCDAVFCDNFMAQKMRNRPLEFGKIYSTEIGSRPEEIIAYLNALN